MAPSAEFQYSMVIVPAPSEASGEAGVSPPGLDVPLLSPQPASRASSRTADSARLSSFFMVILQIIFVP